MFKRYGFFSPNIFLNVYLSPKWVKDCNVIWFEYLKILTHKKLCNCNIKVGRLVKMLKNVKAFRNIEKLHYLIFFVPLKQTMTLFTCLLVFWKINYEVVKFCPKNKKKRFWFMLFLNYYYYHLFVAKIEPWS
jgi:hypothetical protein